MEINFNTFLQKYNLTKDKLWFLGEGANGEASSFEFENKTYVLKYTNKEDEFSFAKLIKEKQLIYKDQETIFDHSVIIYDVGFFIKEENKLPLYDYFIIMEYLEGDENISYLYREYTDALYVGDTTQFESENPNEFESFRMINKIEEFLGANDIHEENIGISEDGVIKGFDWDRR